MELIVLLLPFVLVLGLCLWIFRIKPWFGKWLVAFSADAMLFIGMFISIFIIAFSTPNSSGYNIFIFVGTVLLMIAIPLAVFGKLRNKLLSVPLAIAIFACIGALGGMYAYEVYDDSVPTVGESQNLLYQYIPYEEDTKAVSLDAPSSLTINEDMPRMDGATALYPIYASFAKAVYPMSTEAEKKKAESTVICSTTTGAYQRIVTGEVDIIFVAGPSQEQEQYATDRGVELVFTPIGREAFVFFVNSKNPIEDINLSQVQGIYSGEVTKWSELGVSGIGDIRPFQRDEGSGSQTSLEKLMAGKKLIEPPTEDVIDGMGGIISKTSDYKNYKNAIGYSFRFYSTEMVKNNQIKLLSINGVAPTVENIENGTYPIASYFYAVTRSDASDNTKQLLEWILSEQGQTIIEKVGYVPLK
ncbi:MAG: substrate-binding domain-containing protein [Clostridia bacterium]|nr:substrate-binding domain-containing protein [Clostridia bacterium]